MHRTDNAANPKRDGGRRTCSHDRLCVLCRMGMMPTAWLMPTPGYGWDGGYDVLLRDHWQRPLAGHFDARDMHGSPHGGVAMPHFGGFMVGLAAVPDAAEQPVARAGRLRYLWFIAKREVGISVTLSWRHG